MRLPVAREDGYWLLDKGRAQFVPMQKPSLVEMARALPDSVFQEDGKAKIISLLERKERRQ